MGEAPPLTPWLASCADCGRVGMVDAAQHRMVPSVWVARCECGGGYESRLPLKVVA